MLGKLIKYELKACARVLVPIYCVILVVSLLLPLVWIASLQLEEFEIIFAVAIALSFLMTVIIICFAALSYFVNIFMSAYRYKKNLLDNEGYLMNTLPVTPTQNILAKLLSALIYQGIGLIISSILGFIFFVCVAHQTGIWEEFIDTIHYGFGLLKPINYGTLFKIITLYATYIIIAVVSFNLKAYASLGIGHSKDSHKILWSLCAFLVISWIEKTITSLFQFITSVSQFSVEQNYYNFQLSFIQSLTVGLIVIMVIFAVIYFLIARYFLENKLNIN